MKISIGCDHAAYKEKELLSSYIMEELGFTVIDCGTNSLSSVDYPEFGHKVACNIKKNISDLGIVLCGSGIGISISANKIKGIRAALCTTVDHAIMSRKHNDANVLAMGSRFTSFDEMKNITKNWLSTDFEGGRHKLRIDQIEKYDE